MEIAFTISGTPIAKGRPKFFRRGNYMGTYTPARTRNYEDSVISQALSYKPNSPLENSLRVKIVFYLPIPKSFSRKNKEKAIWGTIRPAKKPDIDNCVKAILDPLNTIFWNDDRQIVSMHAEKFYGDIPRTEVQIETLP